MYLANYSKKIGFCMVKTASKTTPTDTIVASSFYETFLATNTPARMPGYLWRSSTDFVTMECLKIFSWENSPGWLPEIFGSYIYHHTNHSTGLSISWPQDYGLFQFPFCTNGKFIDQCAKED
jgi:hypothetical protein